MYSWNGRYKCIDAESREEADGVFMERFGFFPELVTVSILD